MAMSSFLFRLGIILKGIDALLEIAGGILLLIPVEVDRTIAFLGQHELYIAPRHPMDAHLAHSAEIALSQATLAGAIYLIVHGIVKTVLIAAIFREKKWGYQGLFLILSIFAGI